MFLWLFCSCFLVGTGILALDCLPFPFPLMRRYRKEVRAVAANDPLRHTGSFQCPVKVAHDLAVPNIYLGFKDLASNATCTKHKMPGSGFTAFFRVQIHLCYEVDKIKLVVPHHPFNDGFSLSRFPAGFPFHGYRGYLPAFLCRLYLVAAQSWIYPFICVFYTDMFSYQFFTPGVPGLHCS